MKRIDSVKLILDVYEEFEGRSVVVIDYTPKGDDDPFILAVRQKWQEHYDTMVAELRDKPADGQMFLF